MGGRRAFRRLSGAAAETAVVHDTTLEGQGVATVAGKRVFVARAIAGETVTFRRERSRRSYDEAALLAVDVPSPDRVTPPCAYFGPCGGCSLQHLSAQAQVRLKEATLLESLRRLGAVEPRRVLPAVTGAPLGYRRRARLAARRVPGKGRVLVGFSERDSSRIMDMRSCLTLHPALSALVEPLSGLIGSLALAQRIPQVEAAVADNATVLVLRVLAPPGPADRALLRTFAGDHGVRILLQHGGPGALEPLEAGRDDGELWYELEGLDLRLHFGPTDFIQVNAAVNRQMIDRALELLDPAPGARVLDLYCGIGNFTLPLGRRAGTVLGVEGAAAMVERAAANARRNGVVAARFRAADLSGPDAALAWSGQSFDAVLLDPPRAGAAAMMGPIAASGAARVLYVSCHPGTLARDAGILVREHGFRLEAAGIMDMFPSTSHVESMALFTRP